MAVLGVAPEEKLLNRTLVRLEKSDLTSLPVDVVVYYAREDLQLGTGFGTAIQNRGGAAVRKELDQLGSLAMGEAVITTAGNLNASYIIHACGPKFQEPEIERKLGACMRSALRLASEKSLKSIAFPPMGTGFYGVPLDACAKVMLDVIREHVLAPTTLEEVVICVIDRREFSAFRQRMANL